MTINPVVYEMNLTEIERALLESTIEFWCAGSYQSRERLFSDMDRTVNLMSVAQQIKGGAIAIRISRYQAKILAEVIFYMKSVMKPKTGDLYIPKDCDLYEMYTELTKVAKE